MFGEISIDDVAMSKVRANAGLRAGEARSGQRSAGGRECRAYAARRNSIRFSGPDREARAEFDYIDYILILKSVCVKI